ncbi:hypothetical protein BJX76DRAFT_292860 [Aspergillus varians]
MTCYYWTGSFEPLKVLHKTLTSAGLSSSTTLYFLFLPAIFTRSCSTNMELASDLVARELPALETVGGTTHASVSSNRISAALLHPWETFLVDMWRALQSLNLNIEIPETDETEDYMVGNERGMTTRFVKNVCDPVGKALSITRLSSMVFGDIHSATLNPPSIPDVTILRRSAIPAIHREDLSIVAIGELKTCCTVMLRSNIFDLPVGERLNVEPHIGQVVDHMRQYSLKYSFLSTYTSTVFIRRLEDYRFEISQPVLREARHFSTRECMVAFCAIAAEDTRFTESPDFSELRVRSLPPFASVIFRVQLMGFSASGSCNPGDAGINKSFLPPSIIRVALDQDIPFL